MKKTIISLLSLALSLAIVTFGFHSVIKADEVVAIVETIDGTSTDFNSLVDAFKSAKPGSKITLQQDVSIDKTLRTDYQGITFDLNGHNIDATETAGIAKGAIYMVAGYGWKPIEGIENKMSVINSRPEQGGEVIAELPLTIGTGDSSKEIAGEIGEGVKLTTLNEKDDNIKLKSNAYLFYNDSTKDLIKNGGFKITDIDGKERIYLSYANSITKSSDKVVTLLNDYIGNEVIYSGSQSATLDLNDHTYVFNGKDNFVIDVNYPNVVLKIKNGKITTTEPGVNGAKLVGAGSGASQENNRGLELENVELSVLGEVYGIVTNGTEEGNYIKLYNSTLNVKDGAAIYFPSEGEVIIDNSVINGKLTGVQMGAGSLLITGDKTMINVTGTPEEKLENDGVISDGAAVSIVKREGYNPINDIRIEGGTFKSIAGVDSFKAYQFDNKTETVWDEAIKKVRITGGSFLSGDNSTDVSIYLPEGMEQNKDGEVVIDKNAILEINGIGYMDVKSALLDLKSNDTLTLLNDFVIDEGIYFDNDLSNITIDGNGHIIRASQDFKENIHGQINMMKFTSIDGVTLKDITLISSSTSKHNLDIYDSKDVILENVNLDHSFAKTGAPLINNASEVTLIGNTTLTLGENSWYGFNVDSKNGKASLTQSEGATITSNAQTLNKLLGYIEGEDSEVKGDDLFVDEKGEVIKKADTSKLQALVNDYTKLNKEDYTVDSWKAFEKVLNEAKTLLENEKATQDEVDTMLTNLKEVYEALKEVEPTPEPTPEVDTSKLQALVDELAKLDPKAYTEESYKVLSNALDQASKILNDKEATQEEVNTCIDLLNKAKEQLKEVEPTPEQPEPEQPKPEDKPEIVVPDTGVTITLGLGASAITLAGATIAYTLKRRNSK